MGGWESLLSPGHVKLFLGATESKYWEIILNELRKEAHGQPLSQYVLQCVSPWEVQAGNFSQMFPG